MPIMTLPMTERKPIFSIPIEIYSDRNVLALPFLFRVSLAPNHLNMLDDSLERCPRPEIARDTLLLQQGLILIRNNTSTHQQNVVSTLLPDELSALREGCHVGAVEETHSYNIHILINRHLCNLLGRGQEAGVDYFHACVAEGPGWNQSTSLVSIYSRLHYKNATPLGCFLVRPFL